MNYAIAIIKILILIPTKRKIINPCTDNQYEDIDQILSLYTRYTFLEKKKTPPLKKNYSPKTAPPNQRNKPLQNIHAVALVYRKSQDGPAEAHTSNAITSSSLLGKQVTNDLSPSRPLRGRKIHVGSKEEEKKKSPRRAFFES